MTKKSKDTNGYISFHIKIKIDSDEIVNLKEEVKLPYLTDESHLPHAEMSFKQILDTMLVNPVNNKVSTKIRDVIERVRYDVEEVQRQELGNEPSDIFLEKNEESNNDKQQEGSSGDSGTEGEQGDTKQKSEEGEWEVPDPISG